MEKESAEQRNTRAEKKQWKERKCHELFLFGSCARPTNVTQLSGDKDGKTETDFSYRKRLDTRACMKPVYHTSKTNDFKPMTTFRK